MTKVTVEIEETSHGITRFYEVVATKAGIELGMSNTFDCRHIKVGKGVFDGIENFYVNSGMDKAEFAMVWCCYGPKCDENLGDLEVEFEDGFIC